jgi:hypothetical protein
MLQVTLKILRRHRMIRLYEIALSRICHGRRLLQAMSRSHRERENLVGRKAASSRNDNLEGR